MVKTQNRLVYAPNEAAFSGSYNESRPLPDKTYFDLFLYLCILNSEESILTMNKYTRQTLVVLTGLTVIWQASGQRKIASYEQYIDRYNHLAVEQEKKYHIPASIKLAQAILESDAGRAKLAREANNHFGIKCHNNWKGKKTYHDDDLRNECFRTYGSVTDSYEDHSRFLAERSRYTKLFLLNKKDYRGWAKGLQQCGYATDRAYANKLIKLIEDYELYLYDMGGKSGKKASSSKKEASKKRLKKESVQPKISSANDGERLLPRNVYKTYGLIYTIARYDDSFAQIADDLGFKTKELARYNEVREDFPLRQGDIIYLEKKKKKAEMPNLFHQVQMGESMHSISQYYGIRVKSLYKLNYKDPDYVPAEGETLKLR